MPTNPLTTIAESWIHTHERSQVSVHTVSLCFTWNKSGHLRDLYGGQLINFNFKQESYRSHFKLSEYRCIRHHSDKDTGHKHWLIECVAKIIQTLTKTKKFVMQRHQKHVSNTFEQPLIFRWC